MRASSSTFWRLSCGVEAEADVLIDAQMREEVLVLEQDRERPRARGKAGDVGARPQDPAARRGEEARDRGEQGRLARARRPHHRDARAPGHRQVGAQAEVALFQQKIIEGQHGVRSGRAPRRARR